jgi:hypothetical protein
VGGDDNTHQESCGNQGAGTKECNQVVEAHDHAPVQVDQCQRGRDGNGAGGCDVGKAGMDKIGAARHESAHHNNRELKSQENEEKQQGVDLAGLVWWNLRAHVATCGVVANATMNRVNREEWWKSHEWIFVTSNQRWDKKGRAE